MLFSAETVKQEKGMEKFQQTSSFNKIQPEAGLRRTRTHKLTKQEASTVGW
jgi:hypothetical protein